MEIDPKKPVVLNWSDDVSVSDRDGGVHMIFQQNRRLLMLSVPKSIDVGSPIQRTNLRDALIDIVVEAMEEGPR